MKTLLFSADDVTAIVREIGLDRIMDDTIAKLAQTCRSYTPSLFETPERDGFHYAAGRQSVGLIEWMPALERERHATIKIVGYHPTNPITRNLPTILSVAMCFDTDSGHLNSLMDATFTTALRTGAASALASRILAQGESKTLGMIGCGAQAVTQLHGLSREFEFDRIRVFDVDPAAAKSLAARVAPLGLDMLIEVCPVISVVESSDIICTATSVGIGAPPVLPDIGLVEHVHINAVGSDFPGKLELPLSLLKKSLVCPDFRPQALSEGECQQLDEADIGPDLVELVARADEFLDFQLRPTVFDSTGWALEDHIVVEILTHYGRSLGRGQEVQLETVSGDPANPYALVHEVDSSSPPLIRRALLR